MNNFFFFFHLLENLIVASLRTFIYIYNTQPQFAACGKDTTTITNISSKIPVTVRIPATQYKRLKLELLWSEMRNSKFYFFLEGILGK